MKYQECFYIQSVILMSYWSSCVFHPQGTQGKLHNLTPAQQAYMSSLSHGLDSIDNADQELKAPVNVIALGTDPVRIPDMPCL